MRTIAITFVLCLVTCFSALADQPERSKDPVIGHWRWGKMADITDIVADGSARHGNASGVWKAVSSDNVQRKYEISWKGGSVVDTLTLSEDGKNLHVSNTRGHQFNAVKIEK